MTTTAQILPYVIVMIFGTFLGSFLNVCIYRVPRHESIVWPSSRCPACAAHIAPYDNVPLVSFAVLRGRCRSCHARISLRYPLVEMANGIGYVFILARFGPGWPAAIYAALFSALLVITFIDLDHQIVPDVITLPGIPLGLLCAATVLPVGLLNSVLGLLLGGGLLWVLAWASPYLFGKVGMGGGDIKLLAMIGAFMGPWGVLETIVSASFLGLGLGLAYAAVTRKLNAPFGFGPAIAAGALLALLFPLTTWLV